MDVVTVTTDHTPEDTTTALLALETTAAPALEVVEPLTLTQAKAHLRVVAADDDNYILALITTARQMAEGRLNRTIVQRRRATRFSGWGTAMPLWKPPVISVDGIGYLDETGGEVMLEPNFYFLGEVNEDEVPLAELNFGGEPLPVLASGRRDAVRVYYTAGYAVGQVPAPVVQWMLMAIGTMYANRESEVVGATVYALPDDFMKWLLQPYRVYE